MSVEQVIALVSALSLAILTPGPAIIATVQTAFAHGRERALPYALGLAFGASLWCVAALGGLAVVFRLHPALFAGMKILGGLYLLWFAWALWRASTRPLPPAAAGAKGFFGGIALNLSNPKPALFYAALILSVFPEPMAPARQTLVYGLCLATELFWYALVAVLMSTAPMRARYFAAKTWIDRAAGLAMALLGFLLIVKH
ncbi:Threonine/homoserine/homoserine lactone efflux protein [Paracoccus aminovorans]|uniref:Threonine/homoserine/homoserine lactone efflux protein n=1 Tax=Paracoccus aminovorans TaxID=34004 RepID=A0A1I3EV92_9RHOB|nr:LysE family transporter [Paracoccus aminovorans]CQR86883.1 LysE type translocator [Paracoccus aminovorans]SFI02867.1 Threonine/homoserine/homoserine lactone efflux protein [Paracoccus aminovorans]